MKQTEIGLIPDNWEVKNINKECTIKARIGWQGLKSNEYLDFGDYVLITGTDFDNGFINWKSCNYVSEWRFKQDKNIQIKQGDVLITKDGTIGKVAFLDAIPMKGTLNSGVFVIRPKSYEKIDTVFLSLIFKSIWFDSFLEQITSGSTIVHLYQKDFVTFNFPIPPTLTEQQRIAKALFDVDSLISTTEKLIQKKKNIKQGAMQNLLTGKKRLPKMKQTELGEIPEDWEVKSLGEISTIIMGQSPKSDCYNTQKGMVLIQGNADISNRKTICRFYTTHITKTARKGDVIFTVRAPVGNVAKATFDCCLGRGVCAIQRISDFLYYYLIFIEDSWSKTSTGSTFDSINSDTLASTLIIQPSSKEEQTAIANVLSSMDKEIETLNTKLEKYRNLKTAMMQQLLTGKIRLVK